MEPLRETLNGYGILEVEVYGTATPIAQKLLYISSSSISAYPNQVQDEVIIFFSTTEHISASVVFKLVDQFLQPIASYTQSGYRSISC